jgi:hypothetical protein
MILYVGSQVARRFFAFETCLWFFAGNDLPADLRGGGVQLSHRTPPPPGFVSEANTGTYICYNENEETNPSTAFSECSWCGPTKSPHRLP